MFVCFLLVALLSEERRNASIVVASEKARALKMTKAVFDYVIQSSNKITEQNQRMIAQVVLDTIPMFQKVPSHQRKAIVAAMNHVHYQPNQYLFRQFSPGETFYIIVDGTCKATQSYVEGGAEREINKFMVGDYVDEVALLDHSHVRSFNAISVNNLYCFVLSRNNFDLLMKSFSGGSLNRSLFEGLHYKDNKEGGQNALLRAGLRRISAFDVDNQKSAERSRKFLKALCTFMAESLWTSMYWRMYRSISIDTSLQYKFGPQAVELMRQNYDRNLAVQTIALLSKHILLRKPSERSASDLKFISGLLQQKNEFTKRFCKDWTPNQFLQLAKKVRLHSAGAMARIFEKGSVANNAFLILKGSIRLFCQTLNKVTNSKVLQYENDLAPGDIIGEAALGGVQKRLQVALTITPCEMILISTVDYKSVDELGHNASFSVNEKYQFLKNVPLFRHYEDFSIYRVACAMIPKTISKDQLVCRRGSASETINFIFNGSVDILSDLDDVSTLAKLQQYDYFGESSVLRNVYIEGGHYSKGSKKHNRQRQGLSKRRKNDEEGEKKTTFHFRECFGCKAASSLDILMLPKESFYFLDQLAIHQLKTGYIGRMKWRATRADMIKEDKDSYSEEVALHLTEGNKVKSVEDTFTFDSVTPLDLNALGVVQQIPSKKDISNIPSINQKLNPISLLATSGNAMTWKKNKAMLDRMLDARSKRRPKTSNSLGFTSLFGRSMPTLHADVAMNPMETNSIIEKVEVRGRKQNSKFPRVPIKFASESPNDPPNQQRTGQGSIEALSVELQERRPLTATAAGSRVNGSQKIPPRASVCEMDRGLINNNAHDWQIIGGAFGGGARASRGITR